MIRWPSVRVRAGAHARPGPQWRATAVPGNPALTAIVLGVTDTEACVRGGDGVAGRSYVVAVVPTLQGNVLELTRPPSKFWPDLFPPSPHLWYGAR